ncbi:MAG: polymer-forming cytoskeletal protein [Patescibacteria group bacterium]
METNGPGTIVGVNVSLSGTLKDQNDISVFGMIEGEVISEKAVIIGQSAQVKGPVKGELVTIAGVVRGSITAHEKLELLETGKVFGSISTKNLVIHSGAVLIGKSEMPAGDETEVGESIPEDQSDSTNEESPELTPDEE